MKVTKGLVALLAAVAAFAAFAFPAAAAPTKVSVYASGLFNPKGMAFGPDGTLYVAESGPPGDVKVPLPTNFGGSGPIGTRAAVARVAPKGGKAEQFITGLPNIGLYGGVEMLGAAAVTFMDGKMYEVAAGHMTVSPQLSLVTDGKLKHLVDIGKFNDEHPPPEENGDAVPMGNPFAMVPVDGKLYVSDGNYNKVMVIDPKTGSIRDLRTFRPGPVTTGLTVGPDGRTIYIAQYGNAPYLPGSGEIDTITPDNKWVKGAVKGLTTPIATAFTKDGTMYVLQYAAKFDSKHLRYVVNTGGLFRIGKDGAKTPVVEKLMFPTAMVVGPDGALYVTNFGNESNFGEGQVVRIEPGATTVTAPAVSEPRVHGTYDIPKTNETFDANKEVKGAAKVDIIEPKSVQKWGYSPNVLRVKTGQKIQVTNTGLIAHTLTSVSGAFDTGLVRHNRSAIIVVNMPGEYSFICSPHPWMKGKLIVTGTGTGTGTVASAPVAKVKSPSLNGWAVVLVFGAIVVGVFGLAYVARRRPSAGP